VDTSKETQVNDRKRSVGEELDYQLAVRYFASAFEHCERLPAAGQQSLLSEISKLSTWRGLGAKNERSLALFVSGSEHGKE
jgi:hypothetical protein